MYLPGINIQAPWSELIISGKKLVETRGYPIPEKYVGQSLAVIETPGKSRSIKKARIIGIVKFGKPYKYQNKLHWTQERKLHLVEENDPAFFFSTEKEKWAWPVLMVKRLKKPLPVPAKRGIVFATRCKV